MNNLLKGIIGASMALALAGGAQAAGQENAATTAQDKTLNDASSPMQSTPKAKKSSKAKSKMKSSTSSGSSGTGTTGTSGAESQKSSSGTSSTGGSQGSSGQLGNTQSGSAESAGTMNGVGKTSMDGDTKKQMNDNANPTDASGRSSTTPATTTTGQ